MDERLRVEENLDRGGIDAEEKMRFEDLEALVHHRRGINRDLRTHLPRRVAQRVFDRDLVESLQRPRAERAPGTGEDQPAHSPRMAGPESLVYRAVLRVDRNDLRAALAGGARHQLSRDDHRLLVRQRKPLSRAKGRVGGGEAHSPDEPGDDGVGLWKRRARDEALPPEHDLAAVRRGLLSQQGNVFFELDRREQRLEFLDLLGKQADPAPGRHRGDSELSGERGDDVESRNTDRPGRAEQRKRSHVAIFRRTAPQRTGTAKSSESTRS